VDKTIELSEQELQQMRDSYDDQMARENKLAERKRYQEAAKQRMHGGFFSEFG